MLAAFWKQELLSFEMQEDQQDIPCTYTSGSSWVMWFPNWAFTEYAACSESMVTTAVCRPGDSDGRQWQWSVSLLWKYLPKFLSWFDLKLLLFQMQCQKKKNTKKPKKNS